MSCATFVVVSSRGLMGGLMWTCSLDNIKKTQASSSSRPLLEAYHSPWWWTSESVCLRQYVYASPESVLRRIWLSSHAHPGMHFLHTRSNHFRHCSFDHRLECGSFKEALEQALWRFSICCVPASCKPCGTAFRLKTMQRYIFFRISQINSEKSNKN